MTSTYYRQTHVVIATYAPLVVTGALAWSKDVVGSSRWSTAGRCAFRSWIRLPSIEEVLWRAFDVVTPANHFAVNEARRASCSTLKATEGEPAAYWGAGGGPCVSGYILLNRPLRGSMCHLRVSSL